MTINTTMMASSAPSTIEDEEAELQRIIFDSLDAGMDGSGGNHHLKDKHSPFNSSKPYKAKASRTHSSPAAPGTAAKRKTEGSKDKAGRRSSGGGGSNRRSSGSAASAPAPNDIIKMLEAKANGGDEKEATDFLQFVKTTNHRPQIEKSEEFVPYHKDEELDSGSFRAAAANEAGKRGEPSKTAAALSSDHTSSRRGRGRGRTDSATAAKDKDGTAPPKKRSLSPKKILEGLGFRRQVTNPEALSKINDAKLRRQVTSPEGVVTGSSKKAMPKKTKSKSSSKISSKQKSPQEVLQMLEMCADSNDASLAGAYMEKLKLETDHSERRKNRSKSPNKRRTSKSGAGG